MVMTFSLCDDVYTYFRFLIVRCQKYKYDDLWLPLRPLSTSKLSQRVLLIIFGRVVPPDSPNHDPISD